LIVFSSIAFSHSEIQKSLEGLCDRVTIYGVLERLMEEGFIQKNGDVNDVVKFAGCRSCSAKHSHNHSHFSMQKCKSVTCFEDVEPPYKLPKITRSAK